MLERHQDFLEQEGKKDWGKWLKALGDGFIQMRYFSSQSQLLEFWLNMESTRQLSPNPHPVILDLDTYKYLVKAELFEALWVRYDFLLYRYGVHERAKKLIEEIVEAFPDDSFTYTLQAMYYLQIGQNEEAKQNFMKALKHSPSQFVYRRFIKPSPKLFDRNKFGYSALKHWRDKFSTEASTINDLAKIYHNFGYRQLSNKYLRIATKLNPFYPWSYNKLTSWNNNLKYIEEGLKVNPDSYPLLKAAGHHYQKKGNREGLKKAVALLQRAIKIVPKSEDAYKYLASIYRRLRKYSEAIDTLKEYLKYDNDTLTAVHVKNKIGSIYYDQEDYQKAYEVYKEAASSWQANSLLGVGYSLEKMGRLLEAEEYYQKTAERYPNYHCMELVKFYWRHNRDKEAKDTIIKYLPLNSTRSIIEDMVDYFSENNLTYRIWPTFHEIFKSPKNNKDIIYLARILMKYEEYDYAAPVWEKCFETESNSWIIYLYRYYQCMEKIHGTKKALEKIRPYIKNPVEKFTFVMELQREKLYDATIKLCKEFLVEYPQESLKSRRLGCLSMMTLAALMSGKEDMVKDVVDQSISDLDPKYDDILFVRYLRGELDEHKLLAQVNPKIVGRAAYYIGMKRLLEGKKEQAESYFTIVKEWDRMEMNFTFVEIHLALAELNRLAYIPIKES
jgi:tetratricopeptide (TPR) repeat protein